jgi:hypothetical protein
VKFHELWKSAGSIADASSMRLQDVLKPAGYWFQSLHRVEVARNAAPPLCVGSTNREGQKQPQTLGRSRRSLASSGGRTIGLGQQFAFFPLSASHARDPASATNPRDRDLQTCPFPLVCVGHSRIALWSSPGVQEPADTGHRLAPLLLWLEACHHRNQRAAAMPCSAVRAPALSRARASEVHCGEANVSASGHALCS